MLLAAAEQLLLLAKELTNVELRDSWLSDCFLLLLWELLDFWFIELVLQCDKTLFWIFDRLGFILTLWKRFMQRIVLVCFALFRFNSSDWQCLLFKTYLEIKRRKNLELECHAIGLSKIQTNHHLVRMFRTDQPRNRL